MKTATVIIAGQKRQVRVRTVQNRAPFWVVCCDSHGNKWALKFNCEDSAKCAYQDERDHGRWYTVDLVNNIIDECDSPYSTI